MTVQNSGHTISYAGNGTTTAFAFPYYFLANSDLLVVLRSSAGVDTTQVITTNYSVSGAGVPVGGTVTMVTAPATGTTLVITRDPAITQTSDYVPNDPFPAETHERALDLGTMIDQGLRRDIDGSIRGAIGETLSRLPAAAQRAGKYAAFGDVGQPAVANLPVLDANGQLAIARASIPGVTFDDINAFTVSGYASAGDAGAGALYLRSDDGVHPIEDADGVTWSIPKVRPLDAGHFGFIGDGVAITENNTAWTNLLAAASTIATERGGCDVIFPTGVFRYSIEPALTVANINLLSGSRINTIFEQMTWGLSGLQFRAAKCGVNEITFRNPNTKTALSTALADRYEGLPLSNRAAAIYVARALCNIDNVAVDSFVVGVNLVGGERIWRSTANAPTTTTLVLHADDQQATDDYYNGSVLRLLTVGAATIYVTVTDYVAATNTITFETVDITGFGVTDTWYFLILPGKRVGTRINGLYCDDVDFGILGTLVDEVRVTDFETRGIEQTQGRAPHAIYMSGDAGPFYGARGFTGKRFQAWDCPISHAFKWRNADDLVLDGMRADRARGTVLVEATKGVTIANYQGFDLGQMDDGLSTGQPSLLYLNKCEDVTARDGFAMFNPDYSDKDGGGTPVAGRRPAVVYMESQDDLEAGIIQKNKNVIIDGLTAVFDGDVAAQYGLLLDQSSDDDGLPNGRENEDITFAHATLISANAVAVTIADAFDVGVLSTATPGLRVIDPVVRGAAASITLRGDRLAYDAQTANFTLGQLLTGGTSGATGVITADTDAGTTGTLTLRDVVGAFADNETITDPLGGSATANGTLGTQGRGAHNSELIYDAERIDITVTNSGSNNRPANKIVLAGSTLQLTRLAHAGKTILLDQAAGSVVTLWDATGCGAEVTFIISTLATSNSHIIKCLETNNVIIGGVTIADTDTAGAASSFFANGTNDDTITLNRSTTGSVSRGEKLVLRDIAANLWQVSGTLSGTGAVATPFSATV